MDPSFVFVNGQGQPVAAWVVISLLIYVLVALDKLLDTSDPPAIGDTFPTVDSPYIPDDSPFIPAEKK
jgi:hypothetical protein